MGLENMNGFRGLVPIRRRTLLALPLAATLAAREAAPVRHVSVYAEKGRFGGWPANHGIWNWGNEILCGFAAAYFIKTDPERHQRDRTRPDEPSLARSLDGGETWSIERPVSLLPPEQGGTKPVELREPLDFTAPDFALTLRSKNAHDTPSYFWHSADRGKRWQGPFLFPLFGRKGIGARTDYQVYGKREALVFATAAKEDGREGRPFCARTTDGGLHWDFQGWIGPEPKGFSIMPSSVMLPSGRLLCAVRVKQDENTDWVDLWASDNQGKTWTELARPVTLSAGKSGNPPSLKRLPNGRLCITYGYRSKPYGIHATLSDDNGKTWTPPIVLRDDGEAWDLGYTRDAIRTDGKMVSLYYWSPGLFAEREIVATIWDPKHAA
jgi:hypothetical protein